MTIWTLQAEVISVTMDDDVLMIGFANDASNSTKYLLLQRDHNFNQQDRFLNQDTYHVEINGPDTSFYGGIENCTLGNDQLKFLIATGNKHTSINEIIIYRGVDESIWGTLENNLDKIFADTNVIVALESADLNYNNAVAMQNFHINHEG